MKISIKSLLIACLLGVVVLLLPFSVEAFSTNPCLELKSVGGLDEVVNNVNIVSQEEGGFDFFTYTTTASGLYKVELNMTVYSSDAIDSASRKKIMEMALSTISNSSSIKGAVRTRLYNFVANQDESTSSLVRQLSSDVNSDFASAYSILKPFSGGLSTILGLITMGIFIMLALMIIFDIAYLVLPLLQLALPKDKNDKPILISREAYLAVQDAEKTDGKGSYLGNYVKRKAWQVVILSICVVYLVGGKIYILAGRMIDMFQGFLM